MITVDGREYKKMEAHVAKLGPNVKTEPLDVGDYIINGTRTVFVTEPGSDQKTPKAIDENLIFERKHIGNLVSSTYDDQLWEQVKALAATVDQGYKPYLIFEGVYMYDPGQPEGKKVSTITSYLKRHPERELSFYKTFFSISKFGVDVLFTKDEDGTMLMLKSIDDDLNTQKEPKDYPLRSGMKRSWSPEMKRVYFYDAAGHQLALTFRDLGLKDVLKSPLSRDEAREQLPKKYKSGKTIPAKYIDQFLDLLGY